MGYFLDIHIYGNQFQGTQFWMRLSNQLDIAVSLFNYLYRHKNTISEQNKLAIKNMSCQTKTACGERAALKQYYFNKRHDLGNKNVFYRTKTKTPAAIGRAQKYKLIDIGPNFCFRDVTTTHTTNNGEGFAPLDDPHTAAFKNSLHTYNGYEVIKVRDHDGP